MSSLSESAEHAIRTSPLAVELRRFPWIRPLVDAHANHFASVAPLFAGNPADEESWRQTIARVQRAPRDRGRLCALVQQQLEGRGAPAAALAAARTLADPASVAIVTGQQAGLFGGPLYTILKAVTAIQLARRVASSHGAPAVPVFWVESEDHDWAEIRSAEVLDQELNVRQIALPDLAGAGTQPAASLLLDKSITVALTQLEAALPATEFTNDLLARLRESYRPGLSMGSACARWLDALLGSYGLVVYESADPAAKPLAARIFEHEVSHPSETARLVRDAADRMSGLGHEPQVQVAADAVALFAIDHEGRRPIKRAGDAFAIGETTVSADDLRSRARRHPEQFSPNVLLRPLVQDAIFPTVCYVGGPSELAYQAQLLQVYRAFGVEPPLLYSRVSATLLDSAALRFLERSQMPFETLHETGDTALNTLLEQLIPPTVERAIEATREEMERRARALKEVVVGLDPTLSGAVDTTTEKINDTLKTLHNKIIQASKRKDDTLRRQFTRTRTLAFPGGDPQERALSLSYFVNRYGPALVDRLLELLPLETGHHYLVTL